MRAYFLLLLPLCRFYYLVHSVPIAHKPANLDGESAPELKNERQQISNASKLSKADSEEWEDLVHKALNKYDMGFPPNSGRSPTVVRASMKVLGVPLFREDDFKMDLVLEMTQKWQDKRLSSNRSTVIQLPPQFATQIWNPNIGFEGTLSKIHGAIYFDESHHIHPNGTVVHTFQVSLSTNCPFFRQDYPFDRRTCELSFGSASYSVKNVLYVWEGKPYPVRFLADALASLTEWDFKFFRLYVDIKVSDDGTKSSRITLQLVAARKPAHVIMSFIIPLGVLVILNMIPTYIIDNWPARIISGVGMLATTMGMIHQRPSGSIGYDTSLDYYWYIGFLVSSSCLVQSGVALCLRKREQWDKAFHICTPIATIVALAGLSIFNMIQRRSDTMPDESLIDTALAIFNSTEGLIRRSHYP